MTELMKTATSIRNSTTAMMQSCKLVAHDESQHCQGTYKQSQLSSVAYKRRIFCSRCAMQRICMHKSIMLAVVASLAKRHTPSNAVLEMVPFLELMSCVLLFEPAETVLQAAAYHQLLPSHLAYGIASISEGGNQRQQLPQSMPEGCRWSHSCHSV